MAMSTDWVLVCDAGKARFFEIRGGDPSWHVVEVLMHEASRTKSSDLVTGRPGQRSAEGVSTRHNALAPATSPKDVEKGHFMHTLAGRLDQALRSQRFDRWVLVAPPHVVGMLNSEVTREVESHRVATIGEDLNHLDAHALAARLGPPDRIPAAETTASR